jgi:site-specific recombinase XerD
LARYVVNVWISWSSEKLRKRLWKFQKVGESHPHVGVFCTKSGRKVDRHVMLRDVKLLCTKLGIKIPERTIHAIRHTFALNYLRNGGSVFHLQKALGHSSLDMSRRYANLATEDLQKVHERISLLGNCR